jgi:hypothetical protein
VILALSLVVPPGAVAARRDVSNWAEVQLLDPATRVVVRLHDGEEVRGTVSAVSASGIVIEVEHSLRAVRRGDVREIRTAPRSSLRRTAGVVAGLVVGIVAGFIIALRTSTALCYGCDPPARGHHGGFTAIVLGAMAGALVGLGRAERGGGNLVYRVEDGR